jgi:hypothetical protein|tara:strand:- start:1270 stop:1680 length:411 start_codon:yes stop_codon:yes gene_type:complete
MALLSLIGPATKLVGKYIDNKAKKAELASKLASMAEEHAHELAKGQIDINKEQAKHPSIFVSGARPAIMWVCCLGLLWQFFIQPIVTYVAVLFNPDFVPLNLEMEGLVTLVMSLLGLGAMRSFEKSKGIARENMKK